ncbi:MAG: hypothetical protein U0Q18_22665 [Bryobacteraceae bacterium]
MLDRLEKWKTRYGTADATGLERLLRAAGGSRFQDADSLIRLHECALFFRAYAPSREAARLADEILFSFAGRVAGVEDSSPFEEPEVSGIAGTSFSAVFSYEVARRLLARYPRNVSIDWENYDRSEKLGPVLRRFLPLVREDWPVEAHVPYRQWIEAARPKNGTDLGWLLEQIGRLEWSERDKADLYDSLELLLLWRMGNIRTTRSRLRLPVRKMFYHTGPLLRRSGISLQHEMQSPPLPIRRLARAEACKILELILDTSAMRYRELYGFTYPDAERVFHAAAGRGVDFYFFGVPPEWRLPLRAYLGGMFFKNGVPAGYVEVLSLFERAEVGFNLYYTFRDGETAWLYARLLRLFRQVLGARCFSVDPYQIGLENDEAIESGAFWFYRKLGFRPLDADAVRLVEREEQRMRGQAGYRSSRGTLEKLARSYLLFECADADRGAWDHFRIRKLALRCTAENAAEPVLGSFVPDVDELMRAKQGPDEARYLRLMQRHPQLRKAVIRAGS